MKELCRKTWRAEVTRKSYA